MRGSDTQTLLLGKLVRRVLFDGTHGINVNSRIRLRHQERAPIAADLKRTMREKAKLDELTFALTADVTEAHRQVPIHPDDWHYLGCQVVPGGEVFINTVGTFGIASPSCYWSRVAAAVGRLARYLVARTATTWHMLVADNYLLECGGPAYRRGLLVFFVLCAVLGVPLSWHKTSGGDSLVCGLASSFCCGQGVLAYPRDERSGSYGQRRYRCRIR